MKNRLILFSTPITLFGCKKQLQNLDKKTTSLKLENNVEEAYPNIEEDEVKFDFYGQEFVCHKKNGEYVFSRRWEGRYDC